MERSIRRSSNPATNELIDLVSRNRSRSGPRDVEAELKSHAPEIFQQTRIVEKIPAGGKTYRNVASAHDYNRFLFSMWLNQLPYSREMRSLMALPNRDRITDGVDAMPESVRVYDKTGSTAQLCGNMGIIEASTWSGQRVPYTFVGIIERPGGSNKLRDLDLQAQQRHPRRVQPGLPAYEGPLPAGLTGRIGSASAKRGETTFTQSEPRIAHDDADSMNPDPARAEIPEALSVFLTMAREASRLRLEAGFRHTPASAREALEAMTRHFVTQVPAIPLIRDELIPGPGFDVPVRLYHPDPVSPCLSPCSSTGRRCGWERRALRSHRPQAGPGDPPPGGLRRLSAGPGMPPSLCRRRSHRLRPGHPAAA